MYGGRRMPGRRRHQSNEAVCIMSDRIDHYRGCLLGLAVGDAVGTSVEFAPPGSFEPLAKLLPGR